MSTTVLQAGPQVSAIWLYPRPLARCPSRFPLVPLLPQRPACKPLPSEVWSRIFEYLYALYEATTTPSGQIVANLKLSLLLISKDLNVSS